MSTKQANMNGAYYAPSVAPPIQSYHRPGRGRGRGCGGCFCCVSCLVFKIVIAFLLIVGLGVLIFWLIFRPTPLKFYASTASLKQFNYSSSDNLLRFNLAVNLTIRNPNKNIGVHYDSIEATVVYQDKKVESVFLPPFYQGHKTTSSLHPVFVGQRLVLLGTDEVSGYTAQKKLEVYSIEVELKLRIRFRLGKIRVGTFKSKTECELKVPLSSNRSKAAAFQTTNCDFNFYG